MFYHDVLDERAGIKEMDDNSTVVTYSGNGTANMTIPIKRSEMNYLNYEAPDNVEWLWSITVAIFVLFGMIGAFASGAWADYFGRFVNFSFCFHSTCREVAWYLRLVMVFANLCWVFGSIFFSGRGEWSSSPSSCLWLPSLEESPRWPGPSRSSLSTALWSGSIVVCFIGFKPQYGK